MLGAALVLAAVVFGAKGRTWVRARYGPLALVVAPSGPGWAWVAGDRSGAEATAREALVVALGHAAELAPDVQIVTLQWTNRTGVVFAVPGGGWSWTLVPSSGNTTEPARAGTNASRGAAVLELLGFVAD